MSLLSKRVALHLLSQRLDPQTNKPLVHHDTRVNEKYEHVSKENAKVMKLPSLIHLFNVFFGDYVVAQLFFFLYYCVCSRVEIHKLTTHGPSKNTVVRRLIRLGT